MLEVFGLFLWFYFGVLGLCFAVILCGMDVFDVWDLFCNINQWGPGLVWSTKIFLMSLKAPRLFFAFAMICGRLEIFSIGSLLLLLERIMETLILYSSRDGQTKKKSQNYSSKLAGDVQHNLWQKRQILRKPIAS